RLSSAAHGRAPAVVAELCLHAFVSPSADPTVRLRDARRCRDVVAAEPNVVERAERARLELANRVAALPTGPRHRTSMPSTAPIAPPSHGRPKMNRTTATVPTRSSRPRLTAMPRQMRGG